MEGLGTATLIFLGWVGLIALAHHNGDDGYALTLLAVGGIILAALDRPGKASRRPGDRP